MKTGRLRFVTILIIAILLCNPAAASLMTARGAETDDSSPAYAEQSDPEETPEEEEVSEPESEPDLPEPEEIPETAEEAEELPETADEGYSAGIEEDSEEFEESGEADESEEEAEAGLTDEETAMEGLTDEVAEEILPGAGTLTVKEGQYEVNVTYDETALIPDGAELVVTEIGADEGAFEQRKSQIEDTLEEDQVVNQALLLDIRIMADGEEVEPAEGSTVKLEITMAPEVLGTGVSYGEDSSSGWWEDDNTYTMGQDPGTIALYHFPDPEQDPVLMEEAEITEDVDGSITTSVETESFSDYEAVTIGSDQIPSLRIDDTVTIRESYNWGGRSQHSWTISNTNVARIAYDRANQSGNYGTDLWSNNQSYATITAVGAGTTTLVHRFYQNGWQTETVSINVQNKLPVDDSGKGDPISTISNKRAGIYLLDIIDLDTTPLNVLDERNNVSTKPYDTGVNYGHQLKILGWGAETTGTNGINDYTGGDNAAQIPRQRIVQDQLVNGYPSLRPGNGVTAESLSYLFDGSGSNTQKYSVDKLFKETDNGYFVFDSDTNYATLNPSGNSIEREFTVYNSTFMQDKHADMPIGFLPFMPYDKNEAKGSVNLNKDLEHHFALHMESNFLIPSTGKDADGNDIVFEFSGDDDMWVFIDDKLVLDIGGVHQPVDGSINFSSGQVTVENGTGGTLTNFTRGDEVEHTMKIFYMERGGCDSNCSIKFNMPIKRPVRISKKVDGRNASAYYTEPFSFKIMVETETGSGAYEPYFGGLFPVGTPEEDKTTPSVTPDGNGIYTLKHGDDFETLGIIDTRKWYVQELDVNGTHFGETNIDYETFRIDENNVRIIVTRDKVVNNNYGQNYDAGISQNEADNIKHRARVDFTNKPVKHKITVQKFWEAPPDLQHGTVKVALFKDVSGSLQMVEGTVRDISFDTETNSWKVTYYLFDSADQYVVRELEADGSTPVDPNGKLKIEGEVLNGETVVNHYTVSYQQGTPDADGDRTDEIYNTIYKKVRLIKIDENGDNLAGAVFTLKDEAGSPVEEENATYTSGSDGLIAELQLKAGTYYLKEEEAPTAYAVLPERIVITVTGQEVTAVGETSEKVYVAVHTGSEEANDERFAFSIPNVKKSASLTVIKKDSTDQTKILPGAAFRVYTDLACTQAAEVFQDNLLETPGELFTTGADGTITIYGLIFGETYYLKEVTAPEGYYLLQYPIKVEIGTDGAAVPAVVNEQGTVIGDEAFRISNDYNSDAMNNQMTVLDSPLYDLPSSGGPGTFFFTIIGSALMAAIILLELMDRRKI